MHPGPNRPRIFFDAGRGPYIGQSMSKGHADALEVLLSEARRADEIYGQTVANVGK